MSCKYSPEWYKKKHIVVCTIILIISLIFIVGGGVLFGFLDWLKPFNVLPVAVIMIALGAVGTISTFVILMCLLGDC